MKSDGFSTGGTNQNSQAAQDILLWCTEAITSGDWIAEYATDTTNPGARPGQSYRTADSDNADAVYGTVGVAQQTTSAAGFCMVRVRGYVASANVTDGASVAIGDDLIIGSTAGRAIEWVDGNTNVRIIGRCESTPSSNTAAVTLYPHPKFVE
jgi:hypothetical protein